MKLRMSVIRSSCLILLIGAISFTNVSFQASSQSDTFDGLWRGYDDDGSTANMSLIQQGSVLTGNFTDTLSHLPGEEPVEPGFRGPCNGEAQDNNNATIVCELVRPPDGRKASPTFTLKREGDRIELEWPQGLIIMTRISHQVPTPAITAVQPSSGPIGSVVTIFGTALSRADSDPRILFGSREASIVSKDADSVSVIIPPGLSDGSVNISVEVYPLSSNRVQFQVDSGAQKDPVTSADEAEGFVIGDVLIFLAAGASQSDQRALESQFNLNVVQSFPLIGLVRAKLISPTPANTLQTVQQLKNDPRVDDAFLNLVTRSVQTSLDPDVFSQTWLMDNGCFRNVQSFFPNQGEGITIAIIDTGLDLDLPSPFDQEFQIDKDAPMGLNFAADQADDPTASDFVGHGTAVGAIAAAQAGNGIQGMGMAGRASILPIRVFHPNQANRAVGNIYWVAEALAYAYVAAEAINLSLEDSGREDSIEFYRAVLDRLEAGLANIEGSTVAKQPVIVAASGNGGMDRLGCPACDSRIIAVGSVEQVAGNWVRSEFSNHSDQLDLVAQGVGVLSTGMEGKFDDPGPGTSFAAPQVVGLAALILGENPDLEADEVKNLILTCFVQDVGPQGYDSETGWGRLFIPNPNMAPEACRSF